MQAEAGVAQVCEHTWAGLEFAGVEASLTQVPLLLCSRSCWPLQERRPSHLAHPQLLETASFSILLTFPCRRTAEKTSASWSLCLMCTSLSLFKDFLFVHLSICESHACRCLHSPEEGVGTSGTGVKTGDCGQPDVSAGI